MPGFTVFAQFRGKETSDWDKKYVSELGKISSLTYEKLADLDRIPLIFIISGEGRLILGLIYLL